MVPSDGVEPPSVPYKETALTIELTEYSRHLVDTHIKIYRSRVLPQLTLFFAARQSNRTIVRLYTLIWARSQLAGSTLYLASMVHLALQRHASHKLAMRERIELSSTDRQSVIMATI
jgi:hypothetical protein